MSVFDNVHYGFRHHYEWLSSQIWFSRGFQTQSVFDRDPFVCIIQPRPHNIDHEANVWLVDYFESVKTVYTISVDWFPNKGLVSHLTTILQYSCINDV